MLAENNKTNLENVLLKTYQGIQLFMASLP